MPTYICKSMQSWSPDNTVIENSKRLIYLSHSMSILGSAHNYTKVILKLFRSAIFSGSKLPYPGIYQNIH